MTGHLIPAGAWWTGRLRAGKPARIEDSFGEQAVDTLFYVADNMDERYDPQATLLAARSTRLTTGHALLSNRGAVLATITADTLGGHDTIVGCWVVPRGVVYERRPSERLGLDQAATAGSL